MTRREEAMESLLRDVANWLPSLAYKPGPVIEEQSQELLRRINHTITPPPVEFAPRNDDARRLAEALTNKREDEA